MGAAAVVGVGVVVCWRDVVGVVEITVVVCVC